MNTYEKINKMFIISFVVLGAALVASVLDWKDPVQNQHSEEIQDLREQIAELKIEISILKKDIKEEVDEGIMKNDMNAARRSLGLSVNRESEIETGEAAPEN